MTYKRTRSTLNAMNGTMKSFTAYGISLTDSKIDMWRMMKGTMITRVTMKRALNTINMGTRTAGAIWLHIFAACSAGLLIENKVRTTMPPRVRLNAFDKKSSNREAT
mmetsp:Transcript_4304/g.8588  ORF Transcript_4304/g.8588 Transcript_4304/m.8588 type:complete len:107 (+) Transcript_4304:298-618(+)